MKQLTLDELIEPNLLKLGFHHGSRAERPYKAKGLVAINKITEAAIQVIAHVGLRNCTVARIAEEAECSRGLVQRYFTTLNELYAAIILVTYGRFLRRLKAKSKKLRKLDMAQWISILVTESLDWAQTDDRLALAELVEVQRTDPSIRAALRDANDVVQRLIFDLVSLGIPNDLSAEKREKLALLGTFLRRAVATLASQEQEIRSAGGNDQYANSTRQLLRQVFHKAIHQMIQEIAAT